MLVVQGRISINLIQTMSDLLNCGLHSTIYPNQCIHQKAIHEVVKIMKCADRINCQYLPRLRRIREHWSFNHLSTTGTKDEASTTLVSLAYDSNNGRMRKPNCSMTLCQGAMCILSTEHYSTNIRYIRKKHTPSCICVSRAVN